MTNRTKIIILILTALVLAAGFYFEDEFKNFFAASGSKISKDVQKIDFSALLSQAQKEVFAPSPLKITGGRESQVILLQSKIIAETNLQRQHNGSLPALEESAKLSEAASAKALDIFKNQYFEHISPSGIGPGELVQNYGYNYITCGENLILGNFSSEAEVVQEWMDSPGHRANILNNRFAEIGVAIIKGTYNGQAVWVGVQEFGLPASACPKPSEALKNQIDFSKSQLDFMVSQLDAKKQQVEGTNPRSAPYSQMVNDYNQMVQDYNALAQTIKNFVAQYNESVNIFNNCVAGK